MAKRQINVSKIHVNKKWVKTTSFDVFKNQSYCKKLSDKEILKLWLDSGGKPVKETKSKRGE